MALRPPSVFENGNIQDMNNHHLRGSIALALLLGLAGARGAHAQSDDNTTDAEGERDIALEEVVVQGRMSRYSATKSDTPIMETARSVDIETHEMLIDQGALNLTDAYLYSSGVYGETYGFATRGDWVKVRGLDVPEYRDSLQALFSNYNNTRPDIYTIEQVEILKGPASVLYGRGSPGGIVNVVSKVPQAERHNELVYEYGNYDRVQLAGDFTGSIDAAGEWLYRVILVSRDTDTQVDYVGEDATVIAPSITWQPNEDTNITLLGNFQDNESRAGAQFLPIYGTLLPSPNGESIDIGAFMGDPEFDRYDTETDSVTLLADHQFNAVWSAELTARWTEGEADYRQAWTSFIGGDRYLRNPDGSLYRGGMVPRTWYISQANSEQAAADARARASFSTGALEHEVLMGVQYQDVTTDNDFSSNYALGYNFSPDPATWDDRFWVNVFAPQYGTVPGPEDLLPLTDGPEAKTTDAGVYISDQISWNDWRFTVGLRADDAETDTGTYLQDDSETSFSAGALYQFENGLSPYASYAESFEPVAGVDNITAQPLKPQMGEQWESGLKYQHGPSYFTLAWFDIEISNLANPNALPDAPSQQEGVAEIDGIEFTGVLVLGDVFTELNASTMDTRSPDGYRLPSVPDHQASAWVTWRPSNAWQGFKTGVGVRYVGPSWDGTDTLETPDYTLGDFMIGYTLESWDFMLNVRNLADKEYQATCIARGDCFPGERRTIVGRAAYRF